MTREEKNKIVLLVEELQRKATDPNWRPGQATASHKLDAIRAILNILGYEIGEHPLYGGTSVTIRKQRKEAS